MKTKKFLSMVLALAMIFTLGVSVFAEDAPAADPNKFEATATVNIPTINVSVPDAAPLFINPMGFKVKVSDGEAAAADEESAVSDSKIVSPVFAIENASPMKLDVNVIGSVSTVNKPAGAANDYVPVMSISATPIADTDTKNSVFIYAQFAEAALNTDDVYEFSTAPEATYTAPKDTDTTFPQLALTTKVPTKAVNVGTVEKTDDPDTPAILGFQFRGDCNSKATKDWVADESVTVTLIFSFKPSASQA